MKQLLFLSCCAMLLLFYTSCQKITDCIKPTGEIETQIIELDEIEAFEIFGAFELVIQEGESQKIEITGHPNVIEALLEDSNIKNGTWDVGIKKCITNWQKSDLKIEATLAGNLKRISSIGNADISTEGVFNKIDILALNIEGAGKMNLELGDSIKKIGTQIFGNANITIAGKTVDSNIDIDGRGDINYFNLSAQNSNINITGGGNCEITVVDLLDIKINGLGNLCYKGNPEITSKITGSGKVDNCN